MINEEELSPILNATVPKYCTYRKEAEVSQINVPYTCNINSKLPSGKKLQVFEMSRIFAQKQVINFPEKKVFQFP
jgi:hypothetical protein